MFGHGFEADRRETCQVSMLPCGHEFNWLKEASR